MKIIEKYILKEYIKSVFFCVSGFSLIFIVWDSMARLPKFIAAHTPIFQIFKLYFFVMIPLFNMLMPASLLIATLYTLWQLTRTNQIISMRACGLSMFHIMKPFLYVGFFFTFSLLILNQTVIPSMSLWVKNFRKNKYKELNIQIIKNAAYENTKNHRYWVIDEIDIKNPSILRGVQITQYRKDGTKKYVLFAKKAVQLDRQWWLFNATKRYYNIIGEPMYKGKKKPIPGSKLGVCIPTLREKPRTIATSQINWEYISALDIYRFLKKNSHLLSKERKNSLKYDMYSKLAMPWACIVVILFGIPAGTQSGRQSILTGLIIAILCLLGFYALTFAGAFISKKFLFIPPLIGAWLPNITFSGLGIYMFYNQR